MGKKSSYFFCDRGAPKPPLGHFWIDYPKPTGYRVSLVSVSESGSQKSLMSQKLENIFLNFIARKKEKKTENYFYIRYKTMRIFWHNVFLLLLRGGGGGGGP